MSKELSKEKIEDTGPSVESSERNQSQKNSTQTSAPRIVKKQKKSKSPVKIYVGRRKTSIAQVRLVSGNGEFFVNRKPLKKYFQLLNLQQRAKDPLALLKKEKQYDTFANVKGGGVRGQAEAISLAIARALSSNDPVAQKRLRLMGLLTRDPRMVERKKCGLRKARRAPQFSKR